MISKLFQYVHYQHKLTINTIFLNENLIILIQLLICSFQGFIPLLQLLIFIYHVLISSSAC